LRSGIWGKLINPKPDSLRNQVLGWRREVNLKDANTNRADLYLADIRNVKNGNFQFAKDISYAITSDEIISEEVVAEEEAVTEEW
jgi:uncharacterized protein YjbI with pentapeptide repeats